MCVDLRAEFGCHNDKFLNDILTSCRSMLRADQSYIVCSTVHGYEHLSVVGKVILVSLFKFSAEFSLLSALKINEKVIKA